MINRLGTMHKITLKIITMTDKLSEFLSMLGFLVLLLIGASYCGLVKTSDPIPKQNDLPEIELPEHFFESLDASSRATSIVNRQPDEVSELTQEDFDEIFTLLEISLTHAEKVDIKSLNDLYPELGSNFKEKQLNGLRLLIEAHKTSNDEKGFEGQRLMNEWSVWLSENIENIRNLK